MVTDIDSTGAKILLQLKRRIEENGKKLFLSNLRSNPTIWQFMDIMDVAKALESENLFNDTDTALEHAENLLLVQKKYQKNENYDFEFSRVSLFKGVTPLHLEEIRQKFRHKAYVKGELVFEENESSRDLYILIKGLMTVKIYHPGRDRYKRLITYTPGTIFGEMSFLDGRPRSASLWAEEDAKTLCLPYAEFRNLQDQHPELAFQLIQNIALEINRRLRSTSNQLRQLEDV